VTIQPPTSVLELRLAGWEDYVNVYVDGMLLAERLTAAVRESKGSDKFDDNGLGWGHVDCGYLTVFDRQIQEPGIHKALLFICGCNVAGCGDTDATIETTDNTITLGSFTQGARAASNIAQVTFERDQFIAEVEMINQWFATTYPEAQLRKAQARARRSRPGL
jgi:hypothetical protein